MTLEEKENRWNVFFQNKDSNILSSYHTLKGAKLDLLTVSIYISVYLTLFLKL